MAGISQALMPRSMPAAIAAGRGAPASAPFVWGPGGVPVSAAELARQRKISDALRPDQAPTGPWSLLGDLADEGVASYRDSQATEAEKAAQQTVAAALAKGDYQGVVSNDMATPQQSAVAQALWQQQMKQDDPKSQMDLQLEQAQIDALKAKPVGPEQFDVLSADEATQLGLPPGSYQRGSLSHKVDPIGNGSGVTVNTGDNAGAFTKKGDELAATRMDGILTEGEAAPQTIGDLKTLASLGAQINTGKGAQITEALGPYAEALGVDLKGLPEMQAYKAITDRMAPQMRKPGSGASSDTDVRMFLSALPQLGRTPQGNQIILQTLTAIQRSKQAAAEIAQKAFLPKDQGGISWQEAEKQIQALPDPYEGFSSYAKQADAANNAAKPTTDAEFEALPSGALYIDPDDGNTYRKP